MAATPRPFTILGSSASGGFTIPNSGKATGLRIYNTADQTTNDERLEAIWQSDIATIRTAVGGTGTPRGLKLAISSVGGTNTRSLDINNSPPFLQYVVGSTGGVGELFLLGITSTATSGQMYGLRINNTYNQASGTAANTDLLINRTETAVGSGAQYLIQAQVGASDRFILFNNGNTSILGAIRLGSTSSASANLHLTPTFGSAAAWGTSGRTFRVDAGTATDTSTAASGTAASAVFTSFARPTLAATNASVTTTDAATVYIANAPAAGTNQTITNAYALWIDAGRIRYDETASASVGTASTHKVPINIGGTVYYILLSDV
jgi:hypothetical protein